MNQCNAESLVRTVNNTWEKCALDRIISKVVTQLEKVVCLIKEGRGVANDLMKTRCGPNKDWKFDLGRILIY